MYRSRPRVRVLASLVRTIGLGFSAGVSMPARRSVSEVRGIVPRTQTSHVEVRKTDARMPHKCLSLMALPFAGSAAPTVGAAWSCTYTSARRRRRGRREREGASSIPGNPQDWSWRRFNSIPSLSSLPACNFVQAAQCSFFIMVITHELLTPCSIFCRQSDLTHMQVEVDWQQTGNQTCMT